MIKITSNPTLNGFLKCGVSAIAISAVMSGASVSASEGKSGAKEKAAIKSAVVQEVVIAQEAAPAEPAAAQDADVSDDLEEETEEIVVTGSRIRRNEFTSASPIQVISGEISREIGLFDATEMMQTSVQVTGLQIDNTLNGFVLDNGAGATTVALRGLDPERTLVMINGRRIAPGGVGGAPTSPDLNLIPSIMIDRVETLLDGASAIYGSDAVSGVMNIIMRKGVDGLELEASASAPFEGGGETGGISAIWGKTWDNASITVAGEYSKRTTVKFGDRKAIGACNEFYYEDENGEIVQNAGQWWPRATQSNCKTSGLINRIQEGVGYLGSIYYKPDGETNIGVPGFNEASLPWWGLYYPGTVPYDSNANGVVEPFVDSVFFDANGDGIGDVDYLDPFYNSGASQRAQNADLLSGVERFNIMVNGEYSLDDDNNTEFFFEGLFSQRSHNIDGGGYQLFPWVPEANPTNPCGSNFGGEGMGDGCLVYFFGAPGPTQDSRPIVSINGDRNINDIKANQMRFLTGVRGDLPFLKDNNWSYEAYLMYGRSRGTERSQGILADKLYNSLDTTRWDPDNPGQMICGDGSDGCVVVDMYAPSIYKEGGGDFATQAEHDYVFGERYFETIITQKMAGFTADGDLFTLPWNSEAVPFVIGAEWREDEIVSNPNDVASEGQFIHWYTDEGADGKSNFKELFAETELPLILGKPMVEELTIGGAVRYTDPSFYDGAATFSLRGTYRPVDWLTFRSTYGTSFRAPNLREQFLNGTTGFRNVVDPCKVPEDAKDAIIGFPTEYNAANDTRLAHVLAACAADGIDPTALGLQLPGGQTQQTEVVTGGSDSVSAETSTTLTYGIVVQQPWFDSFDLMASITVYDIEVTGSIEEPGTGSILNKCYDNRDEPNATSFFCERITRDGGGLINLMDTSFINIGRITSRGVDYNLLYQQDFEVGAKTLGVTLDLKANFVKENIWQTTEDPSSATDYAGYPTSPKWRAQGRLSFDYSDFRFSWFTRFIAGGSDESLDFYNDYGPCWASETSCRPVFSTKDYTVHNASLTYSPGDYTVTVGMRNVFEATPSKVDSSGVFSGNNFPYGVGYDMNGRTAFLSLKKVF